MIQIKTFLGKRPLKKLFFSQYTITETMKHISLVMWRDTHACGDTNKIMIHTEGTPQTNNTLQSYLTKFRRCNISVLIRCQYVKLLLKLFFKLYNLNYLYNLYLKKVKLNQGKIPTPAF